MSMLDQIMFECVVQGVEPPTEHIILWLLEKS